MEERHNVKAISGGNPGGTIPRAVLPGTDPAWSQDPFV